MMRRGHLGALVVLAACMAPSSGSAHVLTRTPDAPRVTMPELYDRKRDHSRGSFRVGGKHATRKGRKGRGR